MTNEDNKRDKYYKKTVTVDDQNKRRCDSVHLLNKGGIEGTELDNFFRNFNFTVSDGDTNEKLERLYLDGSLNKIGDIDNENFPQDIPDKSTCEILDDLFSKNQLPFRQVKYCILYLTKPIYMTDYLKEYSYDGRRFIKYQSKISSDVVLSNNEPIIKNRVYWLEVKPYNLENNIFNFDSSEKGRII